MLLSYVKDYFDVRQFDWRLTGKRRSIAAF